MSANPSGSSEALHAFKNANHCFKTLAFEGVIGYAALFKTRSHVKLSSPSVENLEKKVVWVFFPLFFFFLKHPTGNPVLPS